MRGQPPRKIRKIKRLKDLIPWDMKMEAMRRWNGLDKLIHKIEKMGSRHFKLKGTKIENTLKALRPTRMMISESGSYGRSELLENLESAGKAVKWGQYLRAPDVYCEILEKCRVGTIRMNRPYWCRLK